MIFYIEWPSERKGFLRRHTEESSCQHRRRVWSLGWDDPLEEEIATHPSVLAWKIPWTEEPGGLLSMGSRRVGYDWGTENWALSEENKGDIYCLKKWVKEEILGDVLFLVSFQTLQPQAEKTKQDCVEEQRVNNYSSQIHLFQLYKEKSQYGEIFNCQNILVYLEWKWKITQPTFGTFNSHNVWYKRKKPSEWELVSLHVISSFRGIKF